MSDRIQGKVAVVTGAARGIGRAAAVALARAGADVVGIDICATVERTIASHRLQAHPSLDDLLEADRWAREAASALISRSSFTRLWRSSLASRSMRAMRPFSTVRSGRLPVWRR